MKLAWLDIGDASNTYNFIESIAVASDFAIIPIVGALLRP